VFEVRQARAAAIGQQTDEYFACTGADIARLQADGVI
jgi:hypothetical protein